MRCFAAFLSVCTVAACTAASSPEPAPSADPAARASSSSPADSPASAPASATASAPAAAAPSADPSSDPAAAASSPAPAPAPSSVASAPEKVAVEAPSLFDDDGELLPQTEDEPSVDSALFQQRVRSLFDAIAKNDPELARDFFFPRAAYEKVKAIKNPGRDWDARLWKLFVRDVGAYHQKIGEGATFVRVDVPMEKSEWMKPHREGNAIGYHRVKRAQLVVRDAEGKERSLEITSMISWRGEWYVVHLHGFK